MRPDDVNAWMEDEDELFKADVYIRRKLDSIEQNAVPVRPVRDIHQEEDRARRAQRRLKLREATLDVTVMPAALAPLAAAGCLTIPPVNLPAKVVVQEAGAGPSLSAHTLNHNPRLSVSASDVMEALGTSGTGASLAVYAMSPAAPAGLTAAVESAVKAGDTLEVFMGLTDTVTFLDDVDSFKLSIIDPCELWARKTTQALLRKHSTFLTVVGAQVIDPSSGPVKVATAGSNSSGGSSSSATATRGKPSAQQRGGSAAAAVAAQGGSGYIPAPPVVPLHDTAAAYRAYDASITADFQRRYGMGKEGLSRGDAETREALASNFAPRARWLTERAGNIAAGGADEFDVDAASSSSSSFHATRRSSSALVELLRGKRDLRPWIKEAVSYPWLLWNRTEGYDDHIPVHIPLLRVITEHSYVDGYSIRAAWVASMNQAGGMPTVPPRQDLLLTAPKSARAAKASYGDMRSEFVYGTGAEAERAPAASSGGSSRSGGAAVAGKKRSRLDFEPLLSGVGEEEWEDGGEDDEEDDEADQEDDEGSEEEEGEEEDGGSAASSTGASTADAPVRRRRRRQAHDADLYKRSYNPVGCTSRLRNIMAAAAASSSAASSQEGPSSPSGRGGAGRSRGRPRRDDVVQYQPIELPYEMPQSDRVMKVTLSYYDPHQGGGRAAEAVCGPDGRVCFGPSEALVPLYTVGSLLYEAWARKQRGYTTVSSGSTAVAGGASPSRSPGGSSASRRILRLPVPGSASKQGSSSALPAPSSSGRENEWAFVAEDSSRYGASSTTPATGRGARGRAGSATAAAADGGAGEGGSAGDAGDVTSSGTRSSFLGRLLAVFSSRSGSASADHTPTAGAGGPFASPSRAFAHVHQQQGSGSAGRSSGRH